MEDVQSREAIVADLKREELKWLKERNRRRRHRRKVRLSRSWKGDIFVIIVLIAFGFFSAYPLIFTIANSLKPLDEIFKFPPRLLPRRITFEHFVDLLT